jgi:hypothetical protein
MVELYVPVRPSLGAPAMFVWGAEDKHAAPHSLLAAACLSPCLHVLVKNVLVVGAVRVAKDPGTVCCKQHAYLPQFASEVLALLEGLRATGRALKGLVHL